MATIPIITQSQGTAASTQNPQQVGGSDGLISTSGNLQASSSANINNDNTSNSIQLGSQLSSTAPLSSSGSVTVHSSPTTTKPHHVNAAGIVFVIILIVAAIGVFVSISISSKNTTKKLLAN